MHVIPLSILLIKVLNSIGPSTDLSGTSLVTGFHSDIKLLAVTFWIWPSSQQTAKLLSYIIVLQRLLLKALRHRCTFSPFVSQCKVWKPSLFLNIQVPKTMGLSSGVSKYTGMNKQINSANSWLKNHLTVIILLIVNKGRVEILDWVTCV